MFFNKKISGDIGSYDLTDWWLNTLTNIERKVIENTYKPMGYDPKRKPLTEGPIHKKSQSKAFFLSVLAGWFNNPNYRSIANRIIEKAHDCMKEDTRDVLTCHYVYSEMISIYYPQRENIIMFNRVIEACKKQIEIAPKVKIALKKKYEENQTKLQESIANPLLKDLSVWNGKEYIVQKDYDFNSEFNSFKLPSHKGYEQLVIVLNKQGKNDEAIELCKQAKTQGWSGDWDKRIIKYTKAKNL